MSQPAVADDVAARLEIVRGRIVAAGGDPDRVRVVAVTKGFGVDAVRAAVAAGLVDVGENYAKELVVKAQAVADPTSVTIHFVGQLQRNKVRVVAPYVDLYQSVDRVRLGVEIAGRDAGAAVLVQVNLTDDPARGGCLPGDVPRLVAELGPAGLGLDVRGLMAVAPIGSPDLAHRAFRSVRDLADRLGLPERSYGMSHDLEAAVAEGATMIRLGTALFGPR
ncbi:MAG: YggS family pyridoxal phosphate-dependent enzyme [Acidimicrobiales bacterium]